MIFKVRKITMILLFSSFIPWYLCGNDNQISWKGSIDVKDGIRSVKNPEEPIFGKLELKLKKDLILRHGKTENDIFDWISIIELDKNDNIYLIDSNQNKIRSYDKNGKYRFSFGKKGIGPGEFKTIIDFFVGENEEMFVLDSQSIHILDNPGNLKKRINLQFFVHDFFVDENYGWILTYYTYPSQKIREYTIGYFNADLKKQEELESFFLCKLVIKTYEGQIKVRSFFLPHIYSPDVIFKRAFGNKCIFGYSLNYSLTILSSHAKRILIIQKNEKPVPISTKEKDQIYNEYAPSLELKWSKQVLKEALQFPSHRPYFNKILTDEKGRIYVGKIRSVLANGDERSYYYFDVFNNEGYYIYQIKVPENPSIIKRGWLYNIDDINDEEEIVANRFKIENWNELKGEDVMFINEKGVKNQIK